jgi:cation transport ATPase
MAWFLPLVVTVSAGTFLFWWTRAPWHEALFNAMAVLLVACPCAMGLATPVAVWGGLARLAGFGVVARTGDFLAALARCDTVCFDKTGTLSGDVLVVTRWIPLPGALHDEAWVRAAVRTAEHGVDSPVARALTEAAGGTGGGDPAPVAQRLEPGLGVVATVRDREGVAREVRVGERALHARAPGTAQGDGKVIYVSIDGANAAEIELGERWRLGRDEAFSGLRALGLRVEVLTGDPHPPGDLGVPVYGGLSPEQKQEHVAALVREGRTVAFVGDGVNDVAAMSAASVAVALRGGSDLSRAAAMAVFAGEDLRFVPQAIRLARRVVGGIRGNMTFASLYNLTGMALAAGGVLHPVVAALLMVGSSALVAVRALRSARGESARCTRRKG